VIEQRIQCVITNSHSGATRRSSSSCGLDSISTSPQWQSSCCNLSRLAWSLLTHTAQAAATAWSKDDKQWLAGTGGRVNGHAKNRENHHQQHRKNRSALWLQSEPYPKVISSHVNHSHGETAQFHIYICLATSSTPEQNARCLTLSILHPTVSVTRQYSFNCLVVANRTWGTGTCLWSCSSDWCPKNLRRASNNEWYWHKLTTS